MSHSAYKMFLDDERMPIGEGWEIVRSFDEAVALMAERGCPQHISFDHDLGEDSKTGYDLAKWMVNQDLDAESKFIPSGFTFYVHSQNPVGATNIREHLLQYIWCRDDAIWESYPSAQKAAWGSPSDKP